MRISVVLPIFNEADNLQPLYGRLSATLDRIACDYELIFVDDGSTDDSVRILERLAADDSRVKFLSFSRNFGHEIASTAGLDVADGDAVVLMDADLQDPPELIERLLEPWLQGYDVVCARRVKRHGEGIFKRAAAYLFYRGMRRLSSLDLPLDTGDFRLMDRRVVDAFRQFPESQRFVRGLVTWMGFRQATVEYERPARHAGTSKYGTLKLVKLAIDALLSFSAVPLRCATILGLLCVAASLIAGVIVVGGHWWFGAPTAPSSITNLCLTLFGGTQLLAIGILGEYIGRMHRDALKRPLYIVDRQRGWGSHATQARRPIERRSQAELVPRDRSLAARKDAA
jgi:dolichol-phosphate mannosyltransferase